MTESAAFASTSTTVRGRRAKLMLENLSSPVVARVEHRSAERMTVRQALPFLKLDSGVRDEEGRRAVIRSVGVAMEGGTPNLVLDLVYDAVTGPADPTFGLDDTLPAAPIIIDPLRPRRVDHTIPFGFPQRKERAELASAGRSRGGLAPDEAMRCYLLTRRKPEPPVIIEAESGRHLHRERTMLFGAQERRAMAADRQPPPPAAPLAGAPAPGGAGAAERGKPNVAARARALAGAFWGYWVDRRSPSRRAR
jgi:hypothetical protein